MNESPPNGAGVPNKRKSFRWKWLILSIFLVPALLTGSFLAMPMMIIYQADEGFKKAKRTVDPEKLRVWAIDMVRTTSFTNMCSQDLPRSKIPDFVNSLYSDHPEAVLVNPPNSERNGTVTIFWGGGFFHWVMDIGETNFSMPHKSENPEYPYNFEWVPGIYYSREAVWPLL
jgi:hypothetical protein